MTFDYQTLSILRRHHPAWRLLTAESAPLIVSFLHRTFLAPNVRVMAQAGLEEALEDTLFALRESLGSDAFPRRARDYLDDWAADERGWLRKFYPLNQDEPHFDLTPATEKAIAWLGDLTARQFVGTESRLLTLFELLKQMVEGAETDADTRVQELRKRRDQIDAQISGILAGDVPLMNETALKERFQQFAQIARDLLMDFREVEQNFRLLDRRVRERIAAWEGSKGALLAQIMGERDAIADSDQGRSFRAFWDFLMSSRKQEELSTLLARVLELPPVLELAPDQRLRRVHYDWLEAGEHTQRTVGRLSQQLRRFLDDQAFLENRRIMEILHGIEAKALALRDTPPASTTAEIADPASDIELPLERPLYTVPIKPRIVSQELASGDEQIDTAVLFSQVEIDKARLARNIRLALQQRSQVTLRELLDAHPLKQGLAELIVYLQLASEDDKTMFDESTTDPIQWHDANGQIKTAALARVIWSR